MAETTKIEWADRTFSPWEGCQKVGPGCEHCYAETRDQRFTGGAHWGPSAPRRVMSDSYWSQPLKWQRELEKTGARSRVFPSLCDPFDNAAPPRQRQRFAKLILQTPNIDWLLLTKRIGNAKYMLEEMFPAGLPVNVHIGATVVTQQEANRYIPMLLVTPSNKRFLSIEPMLGPIDLYAISTMLFRGAEVLNALTGELTGMFGDPSNSRLPALDWVICGGESGKEDTIRPMYIGWARALRDQCEAAGVPFMFKQWGEWFPFGQTDADGNLNVRDMGEKPGLWHAWADGVIEQYPADDDGIRDVFSARIGKAQAGNYLDGVQHLEQPTW